MKKVLLIVAAVFLITMLFNPIGFSQPPKGPPPGGKGGPPKKGPPKKISHEDFVKMYDRDGNGEVSMDEFLQGPKGPPPGGPPGGKGGPPPKGKGSPPGR